MHGRKRAVRVTEQNEGEEEKAARIAKFAKYRKLCALVLQYKKDKNYSNTCFDLTTKILSINPDFYSLWNYRREIILDSREKLDSTLDTDLAAFDKKNLEAELSLTSTVIANKNPKSYNSWYHRRWCINNFGMLDNKVSCDLDTELNLCDKFLKADERNFHCWNYRSFIIKLKGLDFDTELQFSMNLIERNFSNYSAWHYRSHILSSVISQDSTNMDKIVGIIKEELELIQNAIFTECDDQAGWMYHRWLIQLITECNIETSTATEMVSNEIDVIRQLLELESNSKWALFTLVNLLRQLDQLNHSNEYKQEVEALIGKLKQVDVIHNGFLQFFSKSSAAF